MPKNIFTYIPCEEYDQVIDIENLPHVFGRGGIFICLAGEGYVIINEKKYMLRKNTMCVAFPGTIVQAFHRKEGFQSYTLAIDTQFLRELNIPSAESVHILMRENPCILLKSEQLDNIMQICDMMHSKDKRDQHPYHQQINSHMLMLLCYELAGIYARDLPIKCEPCSHQDILFRRFMSLLATDITTSREVKYYADKLKITPKYLTMVTRQISNRSATEWITRSVILNAKALLSTTQLSVQEISSQLNFANPSFFGQYFLRYTQMTPKEFRRSNCNTIY